MGEAFVGDDLVLVNMDETAVQHEQGPRPGNVVGLTRREMEAAGAFFHKSGKASRAHTTLAAFVCDDNALQKHLPQVFIPSYASLSGPEKDAFSTLAAPLEVWRDSNGWVNTSSMMRLLTRLRQCVRAHRPTARILLILDAASQHVCNKVLVHAAQLQIFLLLIPGQLTWLMQILDVRVFSGLKRRYSDLQASTRGASPTGTLPPASWVVDIGRAVREIVVDTEWSAAFPEYGVQLGRDGVASRLANFTPSVADTPSRRLTDEEFKVLLGRHRVNVDRRFLNGPQNLIVRREALAAELARGRGVGRGRARGRGGRRGGGR